MYGVHVIVRFCDKLDGSGNTEFLWGCDLCLNCRNLCDPLIHYQTQKWSEIKVLFF